MAGLNIPDKASGVLNSQYHDPLIKDIKSVARSANIPESVLWNSMKDDCTDQEVEYIRNLRTASQEGIYGFAYVGRPKGLSVAGRMHLMAAACVRNYINAKVLTQKTVVSHLRDDDMPNPTVLLLPDFYMGTVEGGKVPDWIVYGLLSLLYDRHAAGDQTIIYVSSLTDLQLGLGQAFVNHVQENFLIME